ncbi:MAG: exo-beta-N-acetylmuramidase NamZ family protein [Candidatus Sericytochromatia bacterium]
MKTWGIALLLLAGLHGPGLAQTPTPSAPVVAADQDTRWLPLLQGKRVGLVVNATSRSGEQHLVDAVRARGIAVQRIFAPEHGFRGEADAGAHLDNSRDAQTGLPVISLYGANKQPSPEQLRDLDLLVFDIQDVGVRYYTYLSTLHYVMQAAADNGIPLLVLDRPNPNGDHVDGPVLEPAYRSFVGLHPIPLLHGMTLGELARMIQGEKWLEGNSQLDLTVIPVAHYTHASAYTLPVRPSPNLPNQTAVRLYPSLGLFEGTPVSVGRGTDAPFQRLGLPDPAAGLGVFTPQSRPGATQPPYLGQFCYGFDLRQSALGGGLQLGWLQFFRRLHRGPQPFFNPFFDKLAGTARLRQQLEAGLSESAIRASWQPDLAAFRQRRQPYLLYP